jgi:hypothetical protein
VEFDDDLKRLCNINAHRGVYEYQRLSFSVKSASGIIQAIRDNILAGLSFTTAYLDYTVVVSRSPDDHIRYLHAVFDRINECVFRVLLGKCSFFQPSIEYLGFIVDKDGRRPDPQTITVVADMPAPTNITTLCSFIPVFRP